MIRFITTVALFTGLATAAFAGSPAADPKTSLRQARFLELHGLDEDAPKAFYHGRLGSDAVRVNAYGQSLTGSGPAGSFSLYDSGSWVSGRAGNASVSASVFETMVTGRGARGNLSIFISGTYVHGRMGSDSISINVWGSSAHGRIGNESFNLYGPGELSARTLVTILTAL